MRFKKIKKIRPGTGIPCIILSILLIAACGRENGKSEDREPAPESEWTIMYYGDADNDLEDYLLEDIQEMKDGLVNGQGVNVIVLFDRRNLNSSNPAVFGEDFNDTRLYRITSGRAWRIGGSTQFSEITTASDYEANMGDAATLKKFIQFCKGNYPAKKYALILSNHGGGPMKKKSVFYPAISEDSNKVTKNICQDDTDGKDVLYTAELSNILTSDESVNLLGLDACFMSSIEFAYQFRNDGTNTGFKAEIMIASAPEETSNGWSYKAILNRLQYITGNNGTTDITLGGWELYYNPSSLTAEQLGAIIVEEQRDSTSLYSSQSLTCIDLSKVIAVKTAVDTMAVKLSSGSKTVLESLRGDAPDAALLHYFNETSSSEWKTYPYFDLYNLAAVINQSSGFNLPIQVDAAAVMDAVDALVLYSFANSYFTSGADKFISGKSGVHIFFPDGDYEVIVGADPKKPCWTYQGWYNAINPVTSIGDGRLAWCIDGATASNINVENWFELLDSWYDTSNNTDGGLNAYQW